MPDAFEEQAVLVAAEQAAAEGDEIAAEGHLRKLLDLQTARLGPGHPEVASTLHNLAVVCERAGRVSEAEELYRRAYATASAVLSPTDQLVIRCQEDLNAFLDARTMPVQPPQAAGAHAAAPAPARTPSGVRKPSPPASRQPARPASRVRPPAPAPPPSSSGRWIALAVGGALIAAAGIGWAMFGRTGSEPATRPAAAVSEPAPKRAAAPAKKATPPPAAQPAPPAPVATTPSASTSPEASAAPAEPTPPAPTPSPALAPPPAPAPTPPPEPVAKDAAPTLASDPEGITVTDARLCRQLSTSGGWACTAPEEPMTAGRLYFLTRLDVSQTMEIEHRWYHGDAVIQSVRLRVPAAGRPGYRTFSRQTIPAARTGQWRVELRAPSGAVLQQVQFVVP